MHLSDSLPILALTWVLGSSGAAPVGLCVSDPGAEAGEEAAAPARGVPVETLKGRRAALARSLEPGVAVIRSADPRETWEHAQDSDFRQENDFYYLTGLETAGSWLVLVKPAEGATRTALYVPRSSPAQRIWTGAEPSPSEAGRLSGIAAAHPADQFANDIRTLLGGADAADDPERVYLPLRGRDGAAELVALAQEAGLPLADVGEALAPLRLVKDSVELARMRCAIDITVEAQRDAMRAARPGMREYELEARIEYVFRSRGADRVGFPSIVGSGPNSVILHYDENRRSMRAEDLVVMDIGAEYDYYTADVTRTIPVSGTFTERQRAIYDLVLSTQQAVIDSIRPGATIWQLEKIARLHMRENSRGLCGPPGCDQYFPHSIGHWLGMDVHDVGSYATPFEPGMVLTVEPGIYLPAEGLGVRIEDDVLVTADGREVLSDGAPKTVGEIEALMKDGR